MKRLLVLMLALVMALSVAACGGGQASSAPASEPAGPDYSGLQLFESAEGVSIYMPKDMQESAMEGVTVFYSANSYMMTGTKESFEVLKAAVPDVDPKAMSIDEYAVLIQQVYGLETAFAADSYGNLYTTYTAEVEGNSFLYYCTVRKGAECFWVLNFACLEEESDTYLPQFELWGSSIEVK